MVQHFIDVKHMHFKEEQSTDMVQPRSEHFLAITIQPWHKITMLRRRHDQREMYKLVVSGLVLLRKSRGILVLHWCIWGVLANCPFICLHPKLGMMNKFGHRNLPKKKNNERASA